MPEVDYLSKNLSYKQALRKVLWIHVVMFVVFFTSAIISGSSSVLADSLDFILDAINYALGIYVLTRGTMIKASVAIAKAMSMIALCIPVMLYAHAKYYAGTIPVYEIMTLTGILGIISHTVCIMYIYKFRGGDSNQLSVWVCTITDLISNSLTLIASLLVRFTNSIIPDIIVAMTIVCIAIYGAIIILKQAINEIRSYKT
jgi:Co/Zn/Cd efflux system component